MMDAPISQSALGSSKKGCSRWRHLGGRQKFIDHKQVSSANIHVKQINKITVLIIFKYASL